MNIKMSSDKTGRKAQVIITDEAKMSNILNEIVALLIVSGYTAADIKAGIIAKAAELQKK